MKLHTQRNTYKNVQCHCAWSIVTHNTVWTVYHQRGRFSELGRKKSTYGWSGTRGPRDINGSRSIYSGTFSFM